LEFTLTKKASLLYEWPSIDEFNYSVYFESNSGLEYELEQVHMFKGNVDLRSENSLETCFGDIDPALNSCKVEIIGLEE